MVSRRGVPKAPRLCFSPFREVTLKSQREFTHLLRFRWDLRRTPGQRRRLVDRTAGRRDLRECQGIARDVFGEGVRIKDGQIIRFRDTAARILTGAGWKPNASSATNAWEALRILRGHPDGLASLVEIKGRSGPNPVES